MPERGELSHESDRRAQTRLPLLDPGLKAPIERLSHPGHPLLTGHRTDAVAREPARDRSERSPFEVGIRIGQAHDRLTRRSHATIHRRRLPLSLAGPDDAGTGIARAVS